MKFGTKVKAFPNTEDALVGFVVNPVADADGKIGVQVGDSLYGLTERAEDPNGNNGGTFSVV